MTDQAEKPKTSAQKRIDEAEKALEEARVKLKQAKALKAQQEAKERAARAKVERANDTKRKILVGSLMLEKARRDKGVAAEIKALVDKGLTRDADRALFGLEPLPAKNKPIQPGELAPNF